MFTATPHHFLFLWKSGRWSGLWGSWSACCNTHYEADTLSSCSWISSILQKPAWVAWSEVGGVAVTSVTFDLCSVRRLQKMAAEPRLPSAWGHRWTSANHNAH